FLHWAMVLYVLVGSGRQRRFERVFDDGMAAVCGGWVKKAPQKRGYHRNYCQWRNRIMEVSASPTDAMNVRP
ncbi:TPA: hypothetical protein ACHKJT_005262, partial [Escherichia coli]